MSRKLVDICGDHLDQSVYATDAVQAQNFGKVQIGNRALYYQDGRKTVVIPFDRMDRVFTRVVGGTTTMCCGGVGYAYYRLVVVFQEKEIASIIVGEDEDLSDRILACMKKVNPTVEIGYIPPDN